MKFTKAQERAMEKMTHSWQNAYALRESISTLNALVARGLVEVNRRAAGALFSPRTAVMYRLIANAPG